jgi:hypothetical protein
VVVVVGVVVRMQGRQEALEGLAVAALGGILQQVTLVQRVL